MLWNILYKDFRQKNVYEKWCKNIVDNDRILWLNKEHIKKKKFIKKITKKIPQTIKNIDLK